MDLLETMESHLATIHRDKLCHEHKIDESYRLLQSLSSHHAQLYNTICNELMDSYETAIHKLRLLISCETKLQMEAKR